MPATFVEIGPTSDWLGIKRVVSIWTAGGGPPLQCIAVTSRQGRGRGEITALFRENS
jgi:hypothetical protein